MNQRSLAVSAFGIGSAVLVAVACGGSSTPAPQQPLANDTAEGGGGAGEAGLPAGVTEGALWTCQIGDYDPQPCKFHKDGADWKLTKLLGSQRFDGVVHFVPEGIHFVGQFFCPWGSCDEAMDVTLASTDNGYAADLAGDTVSVQWNAELAGEWGGAGYGNLDGRQQEP
jgi:hypothetical protein